MAWALAETGGAILLGSDAQQAVLQAPAPGTWHLVASSLGEPTVTATVTLQVLTGPDQVLDVGELPDLLDAFGTADSAEDLNGGGVVNDQDLLALLDALFGGTP